MTCKALFVKLVFAEIHKESIAKDSPHAIKKITD